MWPEATLLSLDRRGCVIHVGTFSKTLSPQLHLGYLVMPSSLLDPSVAVKQVPDRLTGTSLQRALAVLLENGGYDRHVRRMRRLQQAQQRALMDALTRRLGDRVRIQGAASGLHLVAWTPGLPASEEPALVQAARDRRTRVYPVGPLYLPTCARSQTAIQRPAGLVMDCDAGD